MAEQQPLHTYYGTNFRANKRWCNFKSIKCAIYGTYRFTDLCL
jgi:hypothetical protein